MFDRGKRGDSLRTRNCAWTLALTVLLLLSTAGGAVAQNAAAPSAGPSAPDTAPADVAAAGENREDLLAEEAPVEEDAPALPDMGKALLRMVLFMLLLLGLLVAGAVVFQRWARGRITLGGPKRPLRVVDRLTLGPKTGICLVNVYGRYLVLGIAEKEISVLLEVPTPEENGENPDFPGLLAQAGSESAAKPAEKDRD